MLITQAETPCGTKAELLEAGPAMTKRECGYSPHNDRPSVATVAPATILIVSEADLSVEQRFRIEAANRKLDECTDLQAVRELAKQLITTLEMERASTRQLIADLQKKSSPSLAQRFGFKVDDL